jgi:DNA-binding Lrp family transcriptional regulator
MAPVAKIDYFQSRPEHEVAPVTAYILIQTAAHASNVAADIRRIEGIESADDVSGPYDVIARATASDIDALGQLVVARIQSVEGITRTLTCPVVQL